MEGQPTGRPRSEERVLVLDFGAQYSQLIARKVRECQVYCEIVPGNTPASELLSQSPRGFILSGGPASVYDPGAPHCDPALLHCGTPVLGICYGQQLMAHLLGGEVERAARREYGPATIAIDAPDPLFTGIAGETTVWMSHGDVVSRLPTGFQSLAHSDNALTAAMGDHQRRLYGVQFHPEVTHTPRGREVLGNFLYRVCGCRGSWTMERFVDMAVEQIRARVGSARALCALSGGVDSAVTAALVHRAIDDQLTCLFVNHGLLRKGEAEQVQLTFRDHFQVPLIYVEAGARFLGRLQGVEDPEEKRRRVGEEFIRVFEGVATRSGPFQYLAQGTLYPDVIESGTQSAATIKTHHNVGGLPDDMRFALLEPLRYLFKDEVRRLGQELGLPEEMVWRQPFPGPGLAIRVVGEVTAERLAALREADAIVVEEIQRAGLYREIAQSFAVLLPVRSVGVMGDQRTYAHPVVVRAVTSDDFMTADWARLPDAVLERISTRVVNEVPAVNRVVVDITSKPPGTIEWE